MINLRVLLERWFFALFSPNLSVSLFGRGKTIWDESTDPSLDKAGLNRIKPKLVLMHRRKFQI